MNKKAVYAFRIVLGGYLAWIGVRLIFETTKEQPTNMIFMCVMGALFVLIGGGYAIYSLKKVLDIRKEERGAYGTESGAEEREPEEATESRSTPAQLNMQATEIKPEPETAAEKAAKPDDKSEVEPDDKPADKAADQTADQTAGAGDSKPEKQEQPEEEIENDYEEK